MNDETKSRVEDLALQVSNLWDDLEILESAKEIERDLYAGGVVSDMDSGSLRDHLDSIRHVIERVREWADFTESAVGDVEDSLDEEFESVNAGEVD